MRICIPIQIKAQGGAHFFLAGFRQYLEQHGHIVSEGLLSRYDVLFLNSWLTTADKAIIGMARNAHAHVVQRVDGAAQDYGRADDADKRQAAVNQLCDLTIFQSHYSRHATREKFTVIRQDGPVIYNPVNLDHFTPEGEQRSLPGEHRIAYVSWSANPLKGWPELYHVVAHNPDLDFILAGNFPDPPALPNLHLMGVLDHDGLAVLLRSCHALLTFSRNESCPNHVLEALASGLPVLYLDSGATRELVSEAGLPVTVKGFRPTLDQLWAQLDHYAALARARACEAFQPATLFQRYLDEIEAIRQQKPRVRPRERWTRALKTPRLLLSLVVGPSRQHGIL